MSTLIPKRNLSSTKHMISGIGATGLMGDPKDRESSIIEKEKSKFFMKAILMASLMEEEKLFITKVNMNMRET